MTALVDATRDGKTLVVQLRRAEKKNALSSELVGELMVRLEAADADPSIAAIVVTGDEHAFSAGADIEEMRGCRALDPIMTSRFAVRDRMSQVQTPLIAAVRGVALAGGCELAMSCDIIVAASDAEFGQPEVRLGLVPGSGGTQRLARAVGKFRAMDILLTGRRVRADEALAAGLVSRVVDPLRLMAEAKAIAETIAALPVTAVRTIKRLVVAAESAPLEEGLALERSAFHLMLSTDDAQEGMSAFCEKRSPRFQGK